MLPSTPKDLLFRILEPLRPLRAYYLANLGEHLKGVRIRDFGSLALIAPTQGPKPYLAQTIVINPYIES